MPLPGWVTSFNRAFPGDHPVVPAREPHDCRIGCLRTLDLLRLQERERLKLNSPPLRCLDFVSAQGCRGVAGGRVKHEFSVARITVVRGTVDETARQPHG